MVKIRKPSYFDKFNCIASECEDTCCAGWGIVIDEKTLNYYKSVEGEFGERLKSEIIEDDGDKIFKLNGTRCSFLNSNNMCDIYTSLGGDKLCYTCKQYPRYTEEFLNIKEIGVSLSCPEAARLILRDSDLGKFQLDESLDELEEDPTIEEEMLEYFLESREIIFEIIKNKNLALNKRASLILCLVKELQDKIDYNDLDEIQDVLHNYKNKEYLQNQLLELETYLNSSKEKYELMYDYINTFKNLKHINQNDPLTIDDMLRFFWQSKDDSLIYTKKQNDFSIYMKKYQEKIEKLLVYFVFRYYMKAIFDYDLSAKIKLAIISVTMIKEMLLVRWLENGELTDEDIVELSFTYSKDIEHSEENIEKLQEIFETTDIFSVENILKVILN